MAKHISLDILPQPDDTTCGPTSLHAIYRYYGEELPLQEIIEAVGKLDTGGTLEVMLALHALRRGYRARICTFNLLVFDPTWFLPGGPDIAERLQEQARVKHSRKLQFACRKYREFLQLGGELQFEDLTPALLRRDLKRQVPVLTGLSATFLYRSAREIGVNPSIYDDIRGEPSGHFVVLHGYNKKERTVDVADPLLQNPFTGSHYYTVDIDRLVCAILLGIATYDASLLVIEPPRSADGHPHRRRKA